MRTVRLLSTIAAVVLIGTTAAYAQERKKDEAPARAPAVQQNAPAEKVAPAMKPGALNTMQKAPKTTGQALKPSDADKPHASDNGAMNNHPVAKSSSGSNGGAAMKSNSHDNSAQGASGEKSSQSATEKSSVTTGQGSAAGGAKLSTEQRSKISAIIKQQKAAPAQLNISVAVGTKVPPNVHLYPLPVDVIAIYPEWRGYDYILIGDEILVINPRTHEIVAVIEA